MAYTGQNICDRVRDQINDEYKREIPDSEILAYANDAAKVMLNKRPDLRIGSLGTALTDIALADNFPFPDQYLPAVIEYCVAMCDSPDDESASEGRSQAAMTRFLRHLYGE